jgi:uncharacterized protein (TIGR00369 family)
MIQRIILDWRTGMLEAKSPDASRATLSQVMLPGDANPQGNVHGGTIMKLVDTAGAIAAHRHCRRRVVTVEVDSMSFLHPVHVGDLVIATAWVTAAWRTSLETAVEVEAENVLTGERRHTSSAFLVYCALDDAGHPTDVPPLALATDDERAQAQAAELRRRRRLRERPRGTAADRPSSTEH